MNTPFVIVALGFVAVAFVFYGLLLREFKFAIDKTSFEPARKKWLFNILAGSAFGWTLFVSIWSLTGRMGNFTMFPFNIMPLLIVPMIAIISLTFSKTFKAVLLLIPPQNLIRLQSFRVFVEILLWALFIQNLAPVQMTFEGRNFDILSGSTAPVVAWLFSRQKISNTGVVIWNMLCLSLLINIVSVAIMSMPTPFRVFTNNPANTIVTVFPVSWLPALLVPLAYGLHFLSLRQLALLKKSVLPGGNKLAAV